MPKPRDERRDRPATRPGATGARLRGWARTLGVAWLASAMAAWRRLVNLAVAARRRAATVGSGWQEAAIALGAYGVYNLVKGFWGGSLEQGRRNAASLIDLERTLGIHVEPDLQEFFVSHHLGMPFWNIFYVGSQVIVLPLTLFLVYSYRRDSYAFLRNMALLSWSAGLVWYALQPVAPPRLLASGFTDTVSSQTFVDLDSPLVRAFYNPVAAMPSLHVGMAPVVAWALWRLTPWAWSRALGLAYPVLVAVSIVVTGNHYVLDIVGGLAVVLPAAALASLLVREPRPRELQPVPVPAARAGPPSGDIRPGPGGGGTA
jgi:membrane-associated phospholipid phosphatase